MATATKTKTKTTTKAVVRLPGDGEDILPVGLAEIADLLGVQRDTVDKWRHRGQLPEPRWIVGTRPAWNWADIDAWAEARGYEKVS